MLSFSEWLNEGLDANAGKALGDAIQKTVEDTLKKSKEEEERKKKSQPGQVKTVGTTPQAGNTNQNDQAAVNPETIKKALSDVILGK